MPVGGGCYRYLNALQADRLRPKKSFFLADSFVIVAVNLCNLSFSFSFSFFSEEMNRRKRSMQKLD
jgi:hypothetical protein